MTTLTSLTIAQVCIITILLVNVLMNSLRGKRWWQIKFLPALNIVVILHLMYSPEDILILYPEQGAVIIICLSLLTLLLILLRKERN